MGTGVTAIVTDQRNSIGCEIDRTSLIISETISNVKPFFHKTTNNRLSTMSLVSERRNPKVRIKHFNNKNIDAKVMAKQEAELRFLLDVENVKSLKENEFGLVRKKRQSL
jgi:hypothetical protein